MVAAMSYALCGLRVVSELPLPDLLPWRGDDRAPDVEIRLGTVPDRLERPVFEGPLLQVGADGNCRYAVAGVAAYSMENGRHVTIQPYMDPTAPDVRVFLLGGVFGLLCHSRGLVPLHAGCVEINGRAVAFAGGSGVGKSTLTAAFLRGGYRVLADDVTVVDVAAPGGPRVLPSFPRIKLWRDSLDGLGLSADGLERSRAQLEKFHLPVEECFSAEPLPLAAIYHLTMASDPRHAGFTPLHGGMAMDDLVGTVYRRVAAIRMGRRAALMSALLRIAALPSFRLARMPDLGALDATVSMLVARHAARDLGGRS